MNSIGHELVQPTVDELRRNLAFVAGLLSECATRVQELADLPTEQIKPALDQLLLDLAAALEAEAGGNDA